MAELSKTEQALQSVEDAGITSPTLDANKVAVSRKENEAFAVQFTPEVLVPIGVDGKPIKAMRQEGNVDYNTGHAVLHLRNGQDLKINCNDWLIIHNNGSYEVVKEADFVSNWNVKEFLNSGSAAPSPFLRPNAEKIPVVDLGSDKPKAKSLEEILATAKGGKV